MQNELAVQSFVTHAYAALFYGNENKGTVHITDTVKYGSGFKYLCAEGHEMYPRCVKGWHKAAPHFVHKHKGESCNARVVAAVAGESDLHKVVKHMIANQHGLKVEFPYVENDESKVSNFRSDAGKEGVYYEVCWRHKLKTNSKKWNYIQSIVNKGAEVYEVCLYNFYNKHIGTEAWTKRVEILLNDPDQLRTIIAKETIRLKAVDEVEREINENKKNICLTKCKETIIDDTVEACINCKHVHKREMYRTYYKCQLIGIARHHMDIEATNVCLKFERKKSC